MLPQHSRLHFRSRSRPRRHSPSFRRTHPRRGTHDHSLAQLPSVSEISSSGLISGRVAYDWLLEVGYVGTTRHPPTTQRARRTRHLPRPPRRQFASNHRYVAKSRSESRFRVCPPNCFTLRSRKEPSWYNGLEVSPTRNRVSHGLQFLASYTFSKTLDSDGANINGTSAGIPYAWRSELASPRWGRASF